MGRTHSNPNFSDWMWCPILEVQDQRDIKALLQSPVLTMVEPKAFNLEAKPNPKRKSKNDTGSKTSQAKTKGFSKGFTAVNQKRKIPSND